MSAEDNPCRQQRREPASADPERREPIVMSTLSLSYTLFLDLLSKGLSRRRHRHIPNVDRFWRLYKRESKEDVAAARIFKRRVAVQ